MAISHFVGTRATSNTKKPPLVSLKKKKKNSPEMGMGLKC